MGSENDGKANMCPCAVKELKPASKQTDGSISVRYNNLLDITLCMHWIRCVAWATSKMRRCTDVLQVDLFLRFIRLANMENVFYMSQNHLILIEWEIFEMNSSEFNEPCHEIHQNSNSDNCHRETNYWDWLKSFVVTDRRRKRNQRIICYVAGHAVALLYCVNKPAVEREQFSQNFDRFYTWSTCDGKTEFVWKWIFKESIVSTDFDILLNMQFSSFFVFFNKGLN